MNWLDPLDLSKRKKLLDMCCICPRGTREGMPYFFFEKSVFVKHTTPHPSPITNPVTRTRTSSRVTYTRSPGPGPGPPQGSPVIVMQVRRLKVAGMGLEKPKLLCYVFILSLSVYSHSSLQHLQYWAVLSFPKMLLLVLLATSSTTMLATISVPNFSDGLIFVRRLALDVHFLDKNADFRRVAQTG